MKRYLIVIVCLAAVLCACTKGNGTETSRGGKTTGGNAANRNPPAEYDQRMTIVSDFYPEYGQTVPDGGQMEPEDLQRIFQYAEYTGDGIQMMLIGSDFQSGRLLYSVANARIADTVLEMGVPTDCFSPELCGTGENGERVPPPWILEDGTFDGHQVILVDVTVTNDGAQVREEEDKFGNQTDPYTFSAGAFLFVYNDKVRPGSGYSNYDTVRYFSGMQEDPNYAYSFRLLPGETVTFTLGFVTGRPGGYFDSASDLLLSNVSGGTGGILIDMGLEEAP